MGGVTGRTATPILYAHAFLEAGATLEIPIPAGYSGMVYGMGGVTLVGDSKAAGEQRHVQDNEMAVLSESGDTLILSAGPQAPAEALVLAGAPLRESMVRYGPFVMNSEEEIEAALRDFRSGRFGQLH
jgi:quercetin 2,3-dioxygenase